MNIKGKNSYFSPKTSSCTKEQYKIRGTETVMYSRANLSRKKTRGRVDTGASLSKTSRNRMSQKTVYTVLTGDSAAVNNNGNKDT